MTSDTTHVVTAVVVMPESDVPLLIETTCVGAWNAMDAVIAAVFNLRQEAITSETLDKIELRAMAVIRRQP